MKKILNYIVISILSAGLGGVVTYLVLNRNINLDNIYNSVVYVESVYQDTVNSGSGFVYKVDNDKNYIITSYHVIQGYLDIYVYNNNKEKQKADIVVYDDYTDIAVLSIEDTLGLKEISIGNSDKVRISDEIYVVGTPLNIDYINTISDGIITFNNRKIVVSNDDEKRTFNTIQVDAKVDNGNSGGPLLDENGKVIGMMFTKEDNVDGISFALPINLVMDIVAKLEKKELKKTTLGANMCNSTNTQILSEYKIDTPNINGVVVLDVKKSYPLYNAGLKKGDVITSFNNKKISNVIELREELYRINNYEIVNLEYYSNGKYYKVKIKL